MATKKLKQTKSTTAKESDIRYDQITYALEGIFRLAGALEAVHTAAGRLSVLNEGPEARVLYECTRNALQGLHPYDWRHIDEPGHRWGIYLPTGENPKRGWKSALADLLEYYFTEIGPGSSAGEVDFREMLGLKPDGAIEDDEEIDEEDDDERALANRRRA